MKAYEECSEDGGNDEFESFDFIMIGINFSCRLTCL